MTSDVGNPLVEPFLATAATVAAARPEVDLEMAQEVFLEAATLLHNGLALDGLDDHDTATVVECLCRDLVAPDPGAAIRARAQRATDHSGELHDPQGVAVAYLVAVQLMML